MAVSLDAGVLLRLTKRSHPLYPVARTAVWKLRRQGELLHILPQSVYEFWAVATRPASARGGLGLSLADADRYVRRFESTFVLLPDTPAVYTEWRGLVVAQSVSGVQAHDARIAAALRVHGVSRLLTFNAPDFARYPGVTALDPAHV